MSELGGLTLPATVATDAATDPILTHLPGFLEAAINHYLFQVWGAVGRGSPVKRSFAHDPEVCDVSSSDFPALFVWRGTEGQTERTSDDRVDFRPRVNVLWVFPVEPQSKLAKTLPVFNGVQKAIFKACDEGRVSTWKVQGDTDVSAASRGSLVWKYAGAEFKGILTANPDAGVTVEMMAGGKLEAFPGLLFTLDLLETALREPSADEYAPHRNTTELTHPSPDETVRLVAFDQPPTTP
jgi:hypothetical protein